MKSWKGLWTFMVVQLFCPPQIFGHLSDDPRINISNLDISNTTIDRIDLGNFDLSSVHISNLNISDLKIGTISLDTGSAGRPTHTGTFDAIGQSQKTNECAPLRRVPYVQRYEKRRYPSTSGVCHSQLVSRDTTLSEEKFREALSKVTSFFEGNNTTGMKVETFGPVLWAIDNTRISHEKQGLSQFHVCRYLPEQDFGEGAEDLYPVDEKVFPKFYPGSPAYARSFTWEEFMSPCDISVPKTGFKMMDQFACKIKELKAHLVEDDIYSEKFFDVSVGGIFEDECHFKTRFEIGFGVFPY